MADLGDIDPVGVSEIAAAAGVKPDTVKKWIDRHDSFPAPRGTVGGDRAWLWGDVRRWLVMTGRLPQTLRYREDGGPAAILCQALDGDDRWRTVARFHDIGLGDWRASPHRNGVEDMGGDVAAAQAWAERLLRGWDEARAAWVRDHPDEPMPPHLLGARL
jgi:hypothetical protein